MKQIEYILENFDFDKVYKVMTCLDWHWFNYENIPNHYQLAKYAEKLLKETDSDGIARGAGGFKTEKVDGILYLSFVVEDWEGEA